MQREDKNFLQWTVGQHIIYICENASDGTSQGVLRPLSLLKIAEESEWQCTLVSARVGFQHDKILDSRDRFVGRIRSIKCGGLIKSGVRSGRVINMLLFSGAALIRCIRLLIKSGPSNCIVITSSTGGLDAVCGLLAKAIGGKWILEIRDIWPDAPQQIRPNSRLKSIYWLLGIWQKLAVNNCAAILSPLGGLQKKFESIARRKIHYSHIPNCKNELSIEHPSDRTAKICEEIKNFSKRQWRTVGYVGSLNRSNRIADLLALANSLRDEGVGMVLVGNGVSLDQATEAARRTTNLLVFPAVPAGQIEPIYQLFDVLVMGLHNLPVYKYGLSPIKYAEYLSAGKPIFCWGKAPDGSSESFLTQCSNESLESGRIAILELLKLPDRKLDEMGASAKEEYLNNYRYSAYREKLLRLIVAANEWPIEPCQTAQRNEG